ncbi:endonuclease/exonuclease/phosphatase family protein [Litoreibacter sp.]|nr:endonuclease/exonuclease/phosphatase family protein [Litoreibacter sp.]
MTYNADLSRKGPGLLVRDLLRFEDPVLRATLQAIVDLRPDVLALQDVDYDHDLVALGLIQDRLKELGHPMPYGFAEPPNTGIATGFDIDRDGRFDTARDRQGYGVFTGQGGIALLSEHPILTDQAQDFSTLLWQDFPDADLPIRYFEADELAVLRLHDVAAWQVPVRLPEGEVQVLAAQAGPPVFDGPENRNGLKNADQLRFWDAQISRLGSAEFVLMGGLNNDPVDGQGLKPPLIKLLRNPFVQDPRPEAASGLISDPNHNGPAAQDTVDWGRDIGSLRVDYILPSASLGVAAAAVERDQAAGQIADLPAHKPVWVDVFWK